MASPIRALRSLLPAVLMLLAVAPSSQAKSVLVSVSSVRHPDVNGLGKVIRSGLAKEGWTVLNGDAEYAAIYAAGDMFSSKLDRPFPRVLPAALKPAWTVGHRTCADRAGSNDTAERHRMNSIAIARECRTQLDAALHLRWLELKNPDQVLEINVSRSGATKGYDVTLSYFQPGATEGRKVRLETASSTVVEEVSRAAQSLMKGAGRPDRLPASQPLPEAPSATLPELEQRGADLREVQVPLPSPCAGRLPGKLELSPESELSRSVATRYGASVVNAKGSTGGTLTCRVSAIKSTTDGLLPLEAVDVVLDCGTQQFRASRATQMAQSERGGLRGMITEALIKDIAKEFCATSRTR